jgi:hypothetical protein
MFDTSEAMGDRADEREVESDSDNVEENKRRGELKTAIGNKTELTYV